MRYFRIGSGTLSFLISAAALSLATSPRASAGAWTEAFILRKAEQSPDRQMIPASTLKVLAATWAISEIGADTVVDRTLTARLGTAKQQQIDQTLSAVARNYAHKLIALKTRLALPVPLNQVTKTFLAASINELGIVNASLAYAHQLKRSNTSLPASTTAAQVDAKIHAAFVAWLQNYLQCSHSIQFADHFRLVDYSGLSPANRVTPFGMTCLLATVARKPEIQGLQAALASPGDAGSTLAHRLGATPGADDSDSSVDGDDFGAETADQMLLDSLKAKTGTLPRGGVVSLVGYVEQRSGSLTPFAYFVNGISLIKIKQKVVRRTKKGTQVSYRYVTAADRTAVKNARAKIDAAIKSEFTDLFAINGIMDEPVSPDAVAIETDLTDDAGAETQAE